MALANEIKLLINDMVQEIIAIYAIEIPITDIDEIVQGFGEE